MNENRQVLVDEIEIRREEERAKAMLKTGGGGDAIEGKAILSVLSKLGLIRKEEKEEEKENEKEKFARILQEAGEAAISIARVAKKEGVALSVLAGGKTGNDITMRIENRLHRATWSIEKCAWIIEDVFEFK